MPTPRRQALRIVVQYLGDPDRYRLIAYGDAAVYRPREFASRADILRALRHLVPGINKDAVPVHNKSVNSRIIFTADVEVLQSQLHEAGLSQHG